MILIKLLIHDGDVVVDDLIGVLFVVGIILWTHCQLMAELFDEVFIYFWAGVCRCHLNLASRDFGCLAVWAVLISAQWDVGVAAWLSFGLLCAARLLSVLRCWACVSDLKRNVGLVLLIDFNILSIGKLEFCFLGKQLIARLVIKEITKRDLGLMMMKILQILPHLSRCYIITFDGSINLHINITLIPLASHWHVTKLFIFLIPFQPGHLIQSMNKYVFLGFYFQSYLKCILTVSQLLFKLFDLLQVILNLSIVQQRPPEFVPSEYGRDSLFRMGIKFIYRNCFSM